MRYSKFTVQGFSSTLSGNYAHYISENGIKTLTRDYGYSKGDIVEEFYTDDGTGIGGMIKIIVNGVLYRDEEYFKKVKTLEEQRYEEMKKEIAQGNYHQAKKIARTHDLPE